MFVDFSQNGSGWLFDNSFHVSVITLYLLYKLVAWLYQRAQGKRIGAEMIYKGAKCKANRDAKVQRILEKYKDEFPSAERQEYIVDTYDTLSKLRHALDSKQLTSLELVLTYVYRSSTIGMELNACADIMFEEAIKSAKEFDTNPNSNHPKGFLHGIPVSFKDHIIVKNTLCTTGTCYMSDRLFTYDGAIAEAIREHGGIPFVKSNVPQMLCLPESLNRVFGNVKNPHNHERAAGGSSGGEGALLASNCSPVGIGTDAGGSIRIPCSFCGVYGFKPSVKRMSRKGIQENCKDMHEEGKVEALCIPGPISRCVDDLVEMTKILLSKQVIAKDITIPDLPFDQDIYDQTLASPEQIRLGYFEYDGLYRPCQTVKRAMKETVESAKQAGITMIPIDATKAHGLLESFGKIMLGGSHLYRKLLNHEPQVLGDNPAEFIEYIPQSLRSILAMIMKKNGMKRETLFLSCIGDYSIDGYDEGVTHKRQYIKEFEQIMLDNNLDGFVCPAASLPAYKHYETKDLAMSVMIDYIANVVNYASGVIPVTRVSKEDLQVEYNDESFPNDHFVKETRKTLENSEGLPVAIQVCARPFQEERCLAMTKIIDDALKRFII